jgi:hypothetical protein
LKKPTACSDEGSGIDESDYVHWNGGSARYVYVLANGSDNPGVPPNLDHPSGTLWRLDVLADADAIPSGVRYGTTPAGSFQALPESGLAPTLKRGETYQLYVLQDIGLPIANCTFKFGDPVKAPVAQADAAVRGWDGGSAADGGGDCTLDGGDPNGFGAACQNDAGCSCRADYCAVMPGQTAGVCTVQGCKETPSLCPSGFSCLDLSAFGAGLPSICTKD